jgi:dolichyl-phosphate beta-glucosyltransferase
MWSIVIPAYNETLRLPKYLAEIRRHATSWPAYEVLVIDDGSTDGTCALLKDLGGEWPALRVIAHRRNRGKGAALRTGIFAARGRLILLADADGAAPIGDSTQLREAIEAGASIACGSRRVRSRSVVRRRDLLRCGAGRLFNVATRLLLRTGVQDTQCGFKLMRREVAVQLAHLTVEDGFALDVELLAMAHELGYSIAEVAINWQDVPAGKVRVLQDGAPMLLALWRIRRRLKQFRGGAQGAFSDSSVASDEHWSTERTTPGVRS